MSETWRVFAAAPLNDDIRALMQLARDRLAQHAWPVRWVDPRLGHITLRFYGDSDMDTIAGIRRGIQQIAARHQPARLSTAGMGAFPSLARARVLWLGLDGDVGRLRALASDVLAHGGDGAATDRRSFNPHITLARLRNGAAALAGVAPAARALDLPPALLPLDRVQLVRSVLGPGGPVYTVIDEWPLGAPASARTSASALDQHEHG